MGGPAMRLILAAIFAAVALGGCANVGGPSSGVYGGIDTGGEIRR
jgi:hypothetical protein